MENYLNTSQIYNGTSSLYEYELEKLAEKEAEKKAQEAAEKLAQEQGETLPDEIKNAIKNEFLESIFTEMEEANGSNSLFTNIDSDSDKILTAEELFTFNDKEDSEKELIDKDMEFIFSKLDSDSDGVLTQVELDSLNGNIDDDKNADSIKKLMVMMGMNIEESAKKLIQDDIDKLYKELFGETVLPEETIIPEDTSAVLNDSSSSYSSSGSSGYGGSSTTTKLNTVEDYNTAIAQKENDKTSIKQKANSEVASIESKIEAELLNAGVSEEKLADYNAKKAQYDTEIAAQDNLISQYTASIQDFNAQLAGIESTKSEYQNQIANLQTTKQNGDTTDSERNTRIDGKIQNLNNAIAQEEAKVAGIKAQIISAEQNKLKAEQEKEKLNQEKDNLLNSLIPQNTMEGTSIKAKIDELKTQIASVRQKEQTDVAAIDSEIQTLKNQKASLERKAESDAVIDKNKESNFDENGKRIGLRQWPQTAEDYLKYGLKSQEAIDRFEMCTQELKEAYIDMCDWAREQGIYLQVNASFRTYEDQVALYAGGSNQLASAPGTSLHEKGLAIDIRPYELDMVTKKTDDATYLKLGTYWEEVLGYEWLGNRAQKTEKWHFEI